MTHTFFPGRGTWYASDSPSSSFSAVFEDDGQTGYFYAYDRSRTEDPILDAMQIYSASDISDREIPSTAAIVWSADGLKAALTINKYAHGVLDFAAKRGYCRTGFPPPNGQWRADQRAAWEDSLMRSFVDTDA